MPNASKAQLGGRGDRKVLEEALAWSDGTLIGGGTLRAHQKTCLIHNSKLIKQRVKEGRSQQPISIIVSSQKDFSLSWDFFHQPIQRWLLSPAKIPTDISPAKGYEREFSQQINWLETLAQFNAEGLSKLLLLGGAQLATSLLYADQINELQLTITPRVLGGAKTWVSREMDSLPADLSNSKAWKLINHEPLGGNEIMLRYFRNHDS